MDAAQEGHVGVVEYLVHQGADVNARPQVPITESCLTLVAQCYSENVLVMCAQQNGWTALMSAARNGHLTVAEFLVFRGADVHMQSEVRDSEGEYRVCA